MLDVASLETDEVLDQLSLMVSWMKTELPELLEHCRA